MVSKYLEKELRDLKQAERDVRNARLAERNRLNGSADHPKFSAEKKPDGIILAEETGPRIAVRCPVPAIQMPRNSERRKAFEADLNKYFGGFTSQSFIGGWVAENGKGYVEKGRIYEVSGHLNTFDVDLARMLFCKLGLDIEEQWMHIEVRQFDALHSQVNSSGSVPTIWPRDPGAATFGKMPARDVFKPYPGKES